MNYERIYDKDLEAKIAARTIKPGCVQAVLIEFNRDDTCNLIKIDTSSYADVMSAQSSFHAAIKRLGFRMTARTFNGNLYTLKV